MVWGVAVPSPKPVSRPVGKASSGRGRKTQAFQPNGIEQPVLRKAREIVLAREDGDLHLVDRKLWNYLLATIYGVPPSGGNIYRIRVGHLMSLMAHTSVARLHESLERLARARLTIDYTDESGLTNTVRGHYLSYHMTHAEQEMLTFSFDSIVLSLLYDPRVFASLSVSSIQKFRSSYALRLYEILSLFVHRRYPAWEIGFQELQSRLDIPDGCMRLDNLKRRVIDPALREIHDFSLLKVSVKYVKESSSRKIIGMVFRVSQQTTAARQQGLLLTEPEPHGRPETTGTKTGATPGTARNRLVLSEKALAEATVVMMGDAEAARKLGKKWSHENRGLPIRDADDAFLSWLMIQHAPDAGPVISEGPASGADDVMGLLLMEWNGQKRGEAA